MNRNAGEEDIPEYGWKHWQIFRACYLRDLSQPAILTVRAFVEGASSMGGMCIFLCAEEHLSGFDGASQTEQDEFYCHRYTAAAAIARCIMADTPNLVIERHSLRLGAQPDVDTWNK